MRLIDADKAIENIMIRQRALKDRTGNVDSGLFTRDIERCIKEQPTLSPDAVPVVRCRECKHRPTKPEKCDDGFDLEFPDEVCPCYCDADPFYSWYPSDDWFCPRGERRKRV